MSGAKLVAAKQAANLLVGELDLVQNRVGLVTFAAAAELVVPLSQGHDQDTITSAINAIQTSKYTNIADGIIVATAELANNQRSQAIPILVLLSDGDSNVGGSPEEVATAAKGAGIWILVAGFGKNANDRLLSALASSPDDYIKAEQPDDLSAAFLEITQRINACSQNLDGTTTPVTTPAPLSAIPTPSVAPAQPTSSSPAPPEMSTLTPTMTSTPISSTGELPPTITQISHTPVPGGPPPLPTSTSVESMPEGVDVPSVMTSGDLESTEAAPVLSNTTIKSTARSGEALRTTFLYWQAKVVPRPPPRLTVQARLLSAGEGV